MKKLTQIAGLAGILIVALGMVVALTLRRFSPLVGAHLIMGGGLLALGVLANLGEIRAAFTHRSFKIGPQVIIQGLAILIVLGLLNVVAIKNDQVQDFTNRHLYTLSRATNQVMSGLPGGVEVIAFFPSGAMKEPRQRLQLYTRKFDKIKNLRFIDPDKNEDIVRAEAAPPPPGVLFKYERPDAGKDDKSRFNRIWITNFDESDITNAFIRVTRNVNPKVWFVTGHGEPGLADEDLNGLSNLKTLLEQQGYQLESMDLTTATSIPQDVATLVVVGPSAPFSQHELKLIDLYLADGGNALIALDPVLERGAISGLELLLHDEYGLAPSLNVVFEPKQHLAEDAIGTWLVVKNFPDHDIAQGMAEPKGLFYLARSLADLGRNLPDVTLSSLAKSSPDSYERRIDYERSDQIQNEEDFMAYFKEFLQRDRKPDESNGPFNLAFAIEKFYSPKVWERRQDGKTSHLTRVVAIGTSTVARNRTINFPYNQDFVLNCFNWLAGEKDLKSIRSPTRTGDRLYLEESQKDLILYISVMILPELAMIIGLAIWWRKR